MIMKMVSMNGQKVYQPIDMEEALRVDNMDDLLFTTEEEKTAYRAAVEEKQRIEAEKTAAEKAASEKEETSNVEDKSWEELIEEAADSVEELGKSFADFLTDAVEKVAEAVEVVLTDDEEDSESEEKESEEDPEKAEGDEEEENVDSDENGEAKVYEENFSSSESCSDFNLSGVLDDFVKAASEGVKFVKTILNPETWFTTDDSAEPESKTARLIKLLPFMSKEDLDAVTEDILQDREEYRELNILSIMPFCSKEACDKLFVNALKNGIHEKDLAGMLPYVSKETLTVLVDEYVSGKYQSINMDVLYPFLSSRDVKKIFDYIIHQKDQ